ncbi:hypothetical protein D9M72_83020 [compost metagenome]
MGLVQALKILTIGALASVAVANAAEANKPAVLHEYVGRNAVTSGLVNMDEAPLSGCQEFSGAIKVGGVQFSPSGATLDLFWFVDRNGTRWSVPTNIGKANFGAVERGEANNLIRIGGDYWVRLHVCGSGGFPSLISLQDMSLPFGVK